MKIEKNYFLPDDWLERKKEKKNDVKFQRNRNYSPSCNGADLIARTAEGWIFSPPPGGREAQEIQYLDVLLLVGFPLRKVGSVGSCATLPADRWYSCGEGDHGKGGKTWLALSDILSVVGP